VEQEKHSGWLSREEAVKTLDRINRGLGWLSRARPGLPALLAAIDVELGRLASPL